MLKKMYVKKLIVCGIVFFSLILVYISPTSSNNLNIKEEIEYVSEDIKTSTIFLLDSNNYLASTKIVTKETSIENLSKELLEALIIDGKKQDSIPSGFKSIIPSNTKINSLTYSNNIIKVDFSEELLNTSKENEEKIIEAIIYTLTSNKNVNGIIIYVNGEILTKLPQSKITLPATLDRSIGINKEYNLKNTNNINKTTIYYISEFNDSKYYVPVTKINNDERSKIEIIIDELSRSSTYKTNLMSYLNSNTKILSVNEKDNILTLNFNNSIFNDINEKDILEEVIYTISLSINDNYNVNEVVFDVDDQEIYKSVLKTIE